MKYFHTQICVIYIFWLVLSFPYFYEKLCAMLTSQEDIVSIVTLENNLISDTSAVNPQ